MHDMRKFIEIINEASVTDLTADHITSIIDEYDRQTVYQSRIRNSHEYDENDLETEYLDEYYVNDTDDWRQKDDEILKLCGKLIGEGESREVYEHRNDPNLVIKVQMNRNIEDYGLQNVFEDDVWNRANDQNLKWLAPVKIATESGLCLVMARTQPVKIDDFPDRLPWFFSQLDAHLDNFGWLDGRIVCHDYGLGSPDAASNQGSLRYIEVTKPYGNIKFGEAVPST